MDETVDDRETSSAMLTTSLAPGTQLGVYRIERVLGEGAMGWVYLAVNDALSRRVAIKALKPQAKADAKLVERFLAEARAVNIIRHENIVECTDTFTDPRGDTYVVMEHLEGMTLRAALRDAVRMPPGRAVRIASQIARAIGAAHVKGIVHRDLKPENIFLITRGDNRDYVKVLDFGIARLRPELGYVTATQTGALMGTPAYMPPEQVAGERASAASDIYALGIILFELVSGRLPFSATNVGTMFAAQLTETPQPLDAVAIGTPKPLAELVARMLEKDPARRPQSMTDVDRTLVGLSSAADAARVRGTASAVDSTADTLMPGTGVAVGRAPVARRRWLAVPIVGVALGAWLVITSSEEPPPPGGAASVALGPSDASGPAADASPLAIGTTTVADAAPAAVPITVDAAVPPAKRTRRTDLGTAVSDVPPSEPQPKLTTEQMQADPEAWKRNTGAVLRGSYAHGLKTCWAMQKKFDPKRPARRKVKLGFAVDREGRVTSATTDVLDNLPEGDAAARRNAEMLDECVTRDLLRLRFLPPLFAGSERIKFSVPVVLTDR